MRMTLNIFYNFAQRNGTRINRRYYCFCVNCLDEKN